MSAADWEDRVYRAIVDWLARLLKAAEAAVLAVFRRFGSMPDPVAVYESTPLWTEAVDDLMDLVDDVVQAGWEATTTMAYPSNNAYAQAQLAMTRNLLARIPDEVYHQVFAVISDGANLGESNQDIAVRVEQVLQVNGSENWPGRARVIAITETNRAYNSGQYAGALLSEQEEGVPLLKEWSAHMHGKGAERTRDTHRAADGQRRRLREPFDVGGFPLMYPGDPAGPPQEVISCRCAMSIVDA